MSVSVNQGVKDVTEADAKKAGLNTSEYVEQVLRDAHYRRLLSVAGPPPKMSVNEERGLRALLDWQHNPDQAERNPKAA